MPKCGPNHNYSCALPPLLLHFLPQKEDTEEDNRLQCFHFLRLLLRLARNKTISWHVWTTKHLIALYALNKHQYLQETHWSLKSSRSHMAKLGCCRRAKWTVIARRGLDLQWSSPNLLSFSDIGPFPVDHVTVSWLERPAYLWEACMDYVLKLYNMKQKCKYLLIYWEFITLLFCPLFGEEIATLLPMIGSDNKDDFLSFQGALC